MLIYTLAVNQTIMNNYMKCIDCKLAKSTILFGVLTFILIVLSYNFLDIKIVNIIHTSDFFGTGISTFATVFSKCFSPKIWAIITILITLASIYKYVKSKPSNNLNIISLTLIATFFIAGTIKVLLARSRPELLIFNNQYGFHFFSLKSQFNSMPSGHTAFSFAGLLAIANFFKKSYITTLAIFIACVVAVSRIVILDHFASDVILAAYIGIFCYLWAKSFVENRSQ